jgi:hypothetical protein
MAAASIDHVKRARRAWPILVKRARLGPAKGAPLTYGELCASLGLHWRSAGWFLGVIQRYCKRHRRPRLQALAINKKRKVPGDGYEGSTTYKGHQKELAKVYAAKWPTKAPF